MLPHTRDDHASVFDPVRKHSNYSSRQGALGDPDRQTMALAISLEAFAAALVDAFGWARYPLQSSLCPSRLASASPTSPCFHLPSFVADIREELELKMAEQHKEQLARPL
jgi:hypothetical protein